MESLLFQVDWKPSVSGIARLYYDTGSGFSRPRSVIAKVQANTRQHSRFMLRPGRMQAFRLELPDGKGQAEIFGARITNLTEDDLVRLDPNEFWQDHDTDGVEFKDDSVVITNGGSFTPDAPLDLFSTSGVDGQGAAFCFVCSFLLCAILVWKLDHSGGGLKARVLAFASRSIAGARTRPMLALVGASAAAVLVSCHPVIFFGKSFVSPNNRAICLYDDFPTVPGSPAGPIEDPKGSDIGAMLWSHLPYSIMEHEAIFQNGELPLWDRWNSGGVSLLGQGQTMIGDPLHWIPIMANGASWAWDCKFILARFVFSFGIGLLVLAAVERLGLAALLAVSSAFLGFFSYRFNHAACFSMGYAPWILFAWLKIARAADWRMAGRWALLLAAANWVELNSGTAKEASMLILGLNFAGVLVVILAREAVVARLRKLAAAGAGLAIFLLLSAPCWLVFLDTLHTAFSSYDLPQVYQIQPSLFLGLFDDMFYRETTRAELHTNPAANFLVLFGVLWAAASIRRLSSDRMFLALALSLIFPLTMAFGLIPPGFIARLPLIGNILHIDNTFSCVLIVLFFPVAAFGLRACRDRMQSPEWRGDCVAALLICGALALAYFGYTQAETRSPQAFMHDQNPMPKSAFFVGYVTALFLAIGLLPLAARQLFLGRSEKLASVLVVGLALFAMHFRLGMYLETKFDPYVMNPQVRVDLQARSPAVEYVKSHMTQPGRVTGFEEAVTPGFTAVLGLESPCGTDPFLNRYHRELMQAMGLKMLWDWRLMVEKDSAALLRPFYDFLGIRYYLGDPGNPADQIRGLRLVGSRDFDVYESPTVWPRAFFTDALGQYRAVTDLPKMIWEGDKRPFAAVQTDEKGIPTLPVDMAARRVLPGADYKVTSNTISFSIDAPAPGVAVVGEGFEEGNFRATVNGKPVNYFRVDHAFKGVFLPQAGHYLVRFSYWPRTLNPALCLSAVGAALLICALFLLFPRGKFRKTETSVA